MPPEIPVLPTPVESDTTLWLKPLRSSVPVPNPLAGAPTIMSVVVGRALLMPQTTNPLLLVPPVPVLNVVVPLQLFTLLRITVPAPPPPAVWNDTFPAPEMTLPIVSVLFALAPKYESPPPASRLIRLF